MSLRERILKRGGRWGIRALRLALASHDHQQRGFIAPEDFRTALATYGIANPTLEDSMTFLDSIPDARVLPAPTGSSSSSSDTPRMVNTFVVMNALCGAVSRDVLRAVSYAFQVVRARYLAFQGLHSGGNAAQTVTAQRTNPTLQFLCCEVFLTAHPDVESSKVSHRDALFCFYTLWGLNRDAAVSQEAFLQFHVDFLVNFPPQNAIALVQRMWDTNSADAAKDELEAMPQLVPDRAASDLVFQSVDANGNGHLSLAELDLAVMRLWPTMNFKPAIMRAYKLAEKSGDGFLNKDEFFEFLLYLVTYNSLLAKFRQIDQNKDGRISLDELKQKKNVLGLAYLGDVELRNLFKEMDRNNGGSVLFEEFCMCIAKRQGITQLEKATNQFEDPKAPSPKTAAHVPARLASAQAAVSSARGTLHPVRTPALNPRVGGGRMVRSASAHAK